MQLCNRSRERDLLPPEQRTFKRVHGLQLPLHPLQILGWLVLAAISLGTFFIVIPLLTLKLQVPLLILVITLLIFHVISHLVALLVDPAEAQLRKRVPEKPEFDRSKHQHIIEKGRCHLCNIDASGTRTKHCWDCNKCVVGFDHHCKWLNNCIGQRNYVAFICCVVSAIASTVAVLAIVVTELVSSSTSNFLQKMENTTLPILAQLPGTGSLVVISIVGILSAIAAILLIHLCVFHGYIACLGLTTYEYMRKRRDKKSAAKIDNQNSVPPTTCLQPRRYHFCESVSMEDRRIDTRSVYICSTHTQEGNNMLDKLERDRKKFHLYFSYETRSNETTQIELTSRTSEDHVSPLELKPSTPSPVSCCFSILNPSLAQVNKKPKKRQASLENEQVRKSCTTMKRIQTFVRTKLRKSVHQRTMNLDPASLNPRKNKITPLTSPETMEKEVEGIYGMVKDDCSQVRLPPKLPPLVLDNRHQRVKQLNNVHSPTASVILKRNQQHMRVRKSVMRKRPRFKVGNHLTQSAQLSPIPESELSKPASPLSPPQHFTFSPVHKK